MRPTLLSLLAAGLTAAAVVGCAEQTPTAPRVLDQAALNSSTTTPVTDPNSPWDRIVEGETGPGSLYAIYVPKVPNGDAVYYAHGFRDVGPVNLDDKQDNFNQIRDGLGTLGYTVAYSSFSENGFAVKDGAQRTHQLRGVVASELGGQPARSFLMGHSLGGGIGLYLAERYPDQYDGALLMCGMVGGSLLQTQYIGNVRALFDFFFPDSPFPGGAITSPGKVISPQEVQMYLGSLLTSPNQAVREATAAKLLTIASTEQAPLPFISAALMPTLVGSVAGALNFHSRGIDNLLELSNGKSPFDNTADYVWKEGPVPSTSPLAPVLQSMISGANAGIERFAIDPKVENYLEHHFTPTGALRIPVLTIHNAYDPGVPAFHERVLADRVEKAGASQMLRQELRAAPGHCVIAAGDAVQSFQRMVAWASGN
jgi:pimeloyl-ACP methyl ester carboxylesterase